MDIKLDGLLLNVEKINENLAALLKDLFCGDREKIFSATHEIWCGLCHQYAFTSPAALDCYDILMYALLNLDDEVKLEILDIFNGITVCTSTSEQLVMAWQRQLRDKLLNDMHIFNQFASHSDECIADYACNIYENLAKQEKIDAELNKLFTNITEWVHDNNLQNKTVLALVSHNYTCNELLIEMGCKYSKATLCLDKENPKKSILVSPDDFNKMTGLYDAALEIGSDVLTKDVEKINYLKNVYNLLQNGAPALFLNNLLSETMQTGTNETDVVMIGNSTDGYKGETQAAGFDLEKVTEHTLEDRPGSRFVTIYARKPFN